MFQKFPWVTKFLNSEGPLADRVDNFFQQLQTEAQNELGNVVYNTVAHTILEVCTTIQVTVNLR